MCTSTTANPLLLARQSVAASAVRRASAILPGSRLAALDKNASSSGCSEEQEQDKKKTFGATR